MADRRNKSVDDDRRNPGQSGKSDQSGKSSQQRTIKNQPLRGTENERTESGRKDTGRRMDEDKE